MESLRLPERAMTHRFDRSRLAEIAEAPPMPRVAFPGLKEISLLRRTLQRVREMLTRRGQLAASASIEADQRPAPVQARLPAPSPSRRVRLKPG
jgi:hypothetical protein